MVVDIDPQLFSFTQILFVFFLKMSRVVVFHTVGMVAGAPVGGKIEFSLT